jgi:hypothetical protein
LKEDKYGDYVERGLTEVASHVAAELGGMLRDAPENRRARILGILHLAGPRSTAAIPDLVQLISGPDGRLTYQVIEILSKIDPKWAEQPKVKELASKIVAEQIARPDPGEPFVKVCVALGPTVVPDLVKHVEGTDAAKRKIAMAALSSLGRGAKDATPAVLKATKEKDIHIRQYAVRTLAKIGVGDKDLVATLLPELPGDLNTDALQALDAVDPDWRKGKHVKAGLPAIFRQLTDKDHMKRRFAVVALGQIGPVEGVIPALERARPKEQDTVVQRFMDVAIKELKEKKK